MQSDILLHVVDSSSPNREEQIEEVNKVLKEIGAETVPQILVLNKIDLAESSLETSGYRRNEYGRIGQIRLSAKTGEGLDFIGTALAETIEQPAQHWCKIFPEVGALDDELAIAN